MRQNPTDDELLRGYLLGELPGPEADRLEQRLLTDDDLFDLMEAIEAELLAAASRGELAPAERERVLRRLASSPEGRERLALAHSLNTLANGGASETRAVAAPVVPFRPRATSPKPAVQWAALAAAGLIAATGLFWFTQQTPDGGDSAPRVVQERPAPANPVQPVPREETAPPIAAAPEAPEPSPTPDRLAGEPGAAVQRPEPVKAVFQLALTSLRGAGDTEIFHLPANAGRAEIQVDLEGLEDSGPFHAKVRDLDLGTVWEKDDLQAQRLDWGTALVLDIPADLLAPGRYEVAVTAGYEPEMVQEFEIVPEDR